MQKVLETNLCIIYYSDSLQKLADATINLLKNKIKQYKIFFGIDLYEKIIVNYFDNIGDFRRFIYNIRGEKDSLPKYAEGTYDEGDEGRGGQFPAHAGDGHPPAQRRDGGNKACGQNSDCRHRGFHAL